MARVKSKAGSCVHAENAVIFHVVVSGLCLVFGAIIIIVHLNVALRAVVLVFCWERRHRWNVQRQSSRTMFRRAIAAG